MVDYISVSEASQRWGVSVRQVQRLLAQGRIPGARKYERSWMIPVGADKPTGFRGGKTRPEQAFENDFAAVIAATFRPMPLHNPDAILDTLTEDRLRLQYEGELAYLRGDFAQTIDCFNRTAGDDAARLRACPIAVAATISLGDYGTYTEIERYLKKAAAGEGSAAAMGQLSLATAAVSVIAPNMVPEWLKSGDFGALPLQVLPNAFYLRAKYFLSTRAYEAMLTTAQTALAFSATPVGVTTTDLYLRISCAVACYCMEKIDQAEQHLLDTLSLALPHGFLTPLAEHIILLGGLMEKCLEQEYPVFYDAVIRQWERTWNNWIQFHNRFTQDNLTLILSQREYYIAMQAARRIPYARIAQQQGISVGRLKNIMQGIYEKLYISNRSELAKLVF